MTCADVINVLKRQSPEEYACDWDNVGLLVGSKEQEVKTIFIALDATKGTIGEAKAAGADFLLTHHPLIFKGIKKVNADDLTGVRIMDLIQAGIACYSMHTNFDVLGMADLAADRIGLADRKVLLPTTTDNHEVTEFAHAFKGKLAAEACFSEEGIGRVGRLPTKMTLRACAKETKKAFGLELVRVYGNPDQEVEIGAICPGSGKSVIASAFRSGAQVLITGDIDHHEGIDAADQGLGIIDAGHYGLEQIFIPFMKQYLERELDAKRQGIEVIAQAPRQPFIIV